MKTINNHPIVDDPTSKPTPEMKKSFIKWMNTYFPNKLTKKDISITHMKWIDKLTHTNNEK